MLFHYLAAWLLPVVLALLACTVTAAPTFGRSRCSIHSHPNTNITAIKSKLPSVPSTSCYPALDFKKPASMPDDNSQWWCDASTEYAFVGFSYEVTACQSLQDLKSDFKRARQDFNSRYIRIYGTCDRKNFYDDVVEAAYAANVGVHALIWFGFDGDSKWKGRRDALFSTLHNNPMAKFVTRLVQFGSEPLFDSVLPIDDLTAQVENAKKELASLNIPVTISEMAFGYQKNSKSGAQKMMDTVDVFNIHTLPYFARSATTGGNAWNNVKNDLNFFVKGGNGKKIYLSENGWPSQESDGVRRNNAIAKADVAGEQAYYRLLDSNCEYFKTLPGGGAGWFWHIWSDNQEPGYGLLDGSGKPKFAFDPRTQC